MSLTSIVIVGNKYFNFFLKVGPRTLLVRNLKIFISNNQKFFGPVLKCVFFLYS